MVNEAPSDIYLTGFVLDPRESLVLQILMLVPECCNISTEYRGANIVRDLNPLSIQKIKIGGRPAPNDPALPATVIRIGTFLLTMLKREYELRKIKIADLPIADANWRLKDLIKKYLKSVYPFDLALRRDETAYEWWKRLDMDKSNDAQPLAVSIGIASHHGFTDNYFYSGLVYRYSRWCQIQWRMNKPALHLHGSIPICAAVKRSRLWLE